MKQPELGRKIVELRTAKGLTQEELVELCKISVRTIQRIESGEVTPRSYTVKTILAALGYDLGRFAASENDNGASRSWMKSFMLKGVDLRQPSEFMAKQLNIAWILGVGYFILGFLEGPAEYFRIASGEMIFGKGGYVIIKIFVLITYIFMQRGFFIIGSLFNNYLVKITSVVLIGSMTLLQCYEIVTVYSNSPALEWVSVGVSVSFGAIGILFGISLIKLNRSLGAASLLAGAFEIIAGALFLTVALSFAGFFVLIPAELLEIILLYRSAEIAKERSGVANFA
ncbi:MAG TPA: helix-turn-helix domain-containing protein [Chryseolinea sp.]